MRPKKIILLIDSDADRQGITRYVLFNHGFAILSASTVYKAAEMGHSAPNTPDLLLAYAPASEEYLMEVAAGMRTNWRIVAPRPSETTRRVEWPSMAQVLNLAILGTMRKRGPGRGYRNPATVPAPTALALTA